MTNTGIASLMCGTALGLATTPSFAEVVNSPALNASHVSPEMQASLSDHEIIVTATRRNQSLQKVPIAVTAVLESQIRAANIADTRDLIRLVPALAFTQGSSTKFNNFVVRGVGTFVNSDGFDQSVGIAFDGVPLGRPGGSIADLVDLDRVEVLEGPQGMLFGKNASAGLINIVTRAPIMGETSVNGRLSYGNFNELQTTATINLPLATNVAMRVSAWRFRHDGYVSAPKVGRDLGVKNSYGGRARLKWDANADTTINVTGEWNGAHQDPSVLTLLKFNSDTLGVRAHELGSGITPGFSNRETSSGTDLFNRQNNYAFTGQIDQKIGGATLTSVTSYRKIKNREIFDPAATSSPVYITMQGDNVKYKQFSEEVRISSEGESQFNYALGIIYFNLNLDDTFFATSRGSTPTYLSVNSKSNLKSEHYAAFGEFTFRATDALRLIAGGRISQDRVSGIFQRNYRDPPESLIPALNGPGAPFGPFSASVKVTATEPSYRFGLQYDIDADVMIYATASRGYKGPGLDFSFTTSATAFNSTGLKVRPEIVKNYEIGLRSRLFDRRLTINITAFAERFTDFQTSVRLPIPAIAFATQNAKELKSTGVEGSIDLRLPGGFNIGSSAAYIDARYTDFNNAQCYPGEPTAPVGTPVAPNLCVNGLQSLNGWPLASSPRWTTNATLRWEGRLQNQMPVFLQATHRYQSRVVFNAAADPSEMQPGYSIFGLSAGIRTEDDRFGLSLYAKNIFDKHFASRTAALLAGSYYSQNLSFDSERTYGLAIDVSF